LSLVNPFVAVQAHTPAAAKRRRYDWEAYLYLLPAFAILGLFHIWPVLNALYISLNTGPTVHLTFAGLKNYQTALGADFFKSLQTTVYFAVGTVPVTMVIALVLAYLLFQGIRAKGLFRVIYFLPYITSTVASAAVWAWVYDPQSGILKILSQKLGLPVFKWLIEPRSLARIFEGLTGTHLGLPAWAQGPSLALVAVIIFSIWQYTGYDTVLFLAGLGNIPGELYEAARIDGANRFQLFRSITLPLLAPTIFFVLIISTIGSFQAFNQIYVMNQAAAQQLGGPLDTTRTVSVYLFKTLWESNNPGLAAAIGVLMAVLILALTLIQFRLLGRSAEAA
jgi:multiple sugar transport system permease protein